jgi:lipopolysaccharide export system protein LptC
MKVARRPQPPPSMPQAGGRDAGAAKGGPRLEGVAPRALKVTSRGARRRLFVGLAKRLLPLVAVGLLALVALWPEFSSDLERGRFTYRLGANAPEGGALTQPRYSGVDQEGRPFTITASMARQVGQERTNLTDPKGDITLGADSWLMVQASQGVYMQRTSELDLSGNVTLYRDDGTTLQTDTAVVDLHAGAASSGDKVHVEGPFGTLDAQGFTVLDRGAVVQFAGPGRLVLNGGGK